MRFIIEGHHDRAMGPFVLEAPDAEAARRGAEAAGIEVYSVTAESDYVALPPQYLLTPRSAFGLGWWLLTFGELLSLLGCVASGFAGFAVLCAYLIWRIPLDLSLLWLIPGVIVGMVYHGAMYVVFSRVKRLPEQ